MARLAYGNASGDAHHVTTRKPAGQSFEDFVERQIRESMEKGEFDRLPGAGKPIEGLDDDDPMWWVKKKLAAEGVNPVLPPDLDLRAWVEKRLHDAMALATEVEVRAALADVNGKIGAFNRTHIAGPPSTLGLVDEHAFVERWRRGRT
jgi:hypothetical protein